MIFILKTVVKGKPTPLFQGGFNPVPLDRSFMEAGRRRAETKAKALADWCKLGGISAATPKPQGRILQIHTLQHESVGVPAGHDRAASTTGARLPRPLRPSYPRSQ